MNEGIDVGTLKLNYQQIFKSIVQGDLFKNIKLKGVMRRTRVLNVLRYKI